MSNYNSQLQSNNIDLQAILDSINELPEVGGIDLPTLKDEGIESDLMLGKQLINDEGNVITGTFTIDNELSAQDNLIAQIQAAVDGLPEAGSSEQATPVISVSSSGLITATAGTKSATKQLITKSATTYTPSTTDQTIPTGTYLIGAQTIKGDANLVASNIKSGVSIFGVNGTLVEGSAGVGDIELCTCNMQTDGLPEPSVITIYYITSEMTLANIMFQAGKSFSCVKNSIIYTDGWNMAPSLSGNVSQISYSMGRAAYYVNGDFTLIQA